MRVTFEWQRVNDFFTKVIANGTELPPILRGGDMDHGLADLRVLERAGYLGGEFTSNDSRFCLVCSGLVLPLVCVCAVSSVLLC